jgi:peroxiredoxin
MIVQLPIPDIIVHVRKGGEWLRRPLTHFFPPDKRILLVTLKGAWINDREVQFYDKNTLGFDSTIVSTVNDSFVLNAWANDLNLNYVKLLPDGNGELAKTLKLLIDYHETGYRSYRSEWLAHNNQLTYRSKLSCL